MAVLILVTFLADSSMPMSVGLGGTAVCLAVAGLIAAGGRVGLRAALLGVALGALGTLLAQSLAGITGDRLLSWVVLIVPAALAVFSYLAALQMSRELSKRRRVEHGRRVAVTSADPTRPSGEADD